MNAMDTYFDNLKRLLEEALNTQRNSMERAARAIADCLHSGHMLYTMGSGHGHLLALELFYRAGGMACVCPILDEKLMLHVDAAESTQWERREEMVSVLLQKYPVTAGDVVIVTSNSGRNAVPVLMAKAARERGAVVIALTSMKHSSAVTARNSAGLRLFETADIVLDNGGILGDASVETAGGMMVGPTSTAVGAAMLQAIVCRVKQIADSEGWEAEFFKSSNVDGGDEYNEKLLEKYGKRVPGLSGR